MPPVLSVKGLSKSYKGGLQALKTVDLEIERGEIFALLGPNGAGKTTLINAVCGIITPTTGEIIAAGDCAQVSKAMLAVEMRLPPTQCNYQPILAKNPPALCPAGSPVTLASAWGWWSISVTW